MLSTYMTRMPKTLMTTSFLDALVRICHTTTIMMARTIASVRMLLTQT